MSSRTKFLTMLALVLLALGVWFYASGRASTTVNLTLTTNPDLESGLVGHWTFDGEDISAAQETTSTDAVYPSSGSSLAGGNVDWLNPGGIVSSNNNYASAFLNQDQETDPLYAYNFDFSSIPDNAIIVGIDAWIERRSTGAGSVYDVEVRLVDGSGNIVGDNKAKTDVYWPTTIGGDWSTIYGGAGDMWGTSFTVADLKDPDFGLVLRAKNISALARTVTVDAVEIYVRYMLITPTADDRSGNNNSGTIYGATAVSGVLGQGMGFDGESTFISAGDLADETDNVSYLSVALWVFQDTLRTPGDTRMPVAKYDSVIGQWRFMTRYDGGDPSPMEDHVAFGLDYTNYGYTDDRIHNAGRWEHWVAVFDGTQSGNANRLKIFINGVSQPLSFNGTIPSITGANNISAIIGAENGGDRGFWNGSLDDVRIYNRALSAEEVKRLYELGATTRVAETITTNPDLESGLVGHWTFDGQDVDWGSTTAEIKDRSGNGYHINAVNAGRTSTVPGVIGQGIRVDSSTQTLQIPQDTVIYTNEGPITFAGWFNIHDSIEGRLFDFRDNDLGRFQLDFEPGNERMRFAVDYDGTNLEAYSPNGSLPVGEWNHVVMTWEGTAASTSVIFYVDGVRYDPFFVVEGVGDRVIETGIGGYLGGNSNRQIDSSIDDARFYNRALSAEEVKRLYELGATTRVAETITTNPDLESGLVGHWTFDGQDVDWASTTGEIRDRSGQGNNGDATGLTTSSVMGGVMGQGMGFPGTWNSLVAVATSSSWTSIDAQTVCSWIYLNTLTNEHADAEQYIAGSWPMRFRIDTSGIVQFDMQTDATNPRTWSTTSLVPGEWFHVCAVHYGIGVASPSIYIEGVDRSDPQSVGSGTMWDPNYYPLGIGRAGANWSVGNLDGTLDDVRIYNRALRADEVRRLYELGR